MQSVWEAASRRADIESREDIVRLVRTFYARATSDDLIGFIFTDVARLDLEAHLPVMFDFWETLLFDAHKYAGGAMHKHLELNEKTPLLPEHFARWLQLFDESVDALFEGERAEEAKVKARYIGRSMQLRMSGARAQLAIRQAQGPARE